MKEPNYSKFRAIISDPNLYGDEIMQLIRTNMKYLGVSKKAYDAVYEGFWDIYCKKPQSPDLHPKKVDGFLTRIKLVTPPLDQPPAEEGGEYISSPVYLPLKAIVRIRIPLKRPALEMT